MTSPTNAIKEESTLVHFIWVGLPRIISDLGPPCVIGDQCDVAGPCSIVEKSQQSPNTVYQFWCQKKYQGFYNRYFQIEKINMTVCAIEDELNKPSMFSEEVKQLYQLLLSDTRGNVRDRVTFKELFCFYLLLMHPGYVFDTTLFAHGDIIFKKLTSCMMPKLFPWVNINYDVDVWASGSSDTNLARTRAISMLSQFIHRIYATEGDYLKNGYCEKKHSDEYINAILHIVVKTMLLTDQDGTKPDLHGLNFWETIYTLPGYPVLILDENLPLLKDYNNTHGALDRGIISQIHRAAAKGDIEKLHEELEKNPNLIHQTITSWDKKKLTPLDMALRYRQQAAAEFLMLREHVENDGVVAKQRHRFDFSPPPQQSSEYTGTPGVTPRNLFSQPPSEAPSPQRSDSMPFPDKRKLRI